MKRHLNTLFITTQGTYLSKEGECVCVNMEGRPAVKIPIHTLEGLVLFGQVSCSPFLMGHCAENNVTVSWLTENGKFMASLRGPVCGNVLLRREQYRKADNADFSSLAARAIVIGKIVNCRTMLHRAARDGEEQGTAAAREALKDAGDRLGWAIAELKKPLNLEAVRGIEGDAAHTYFTVFPHLIRNTDPAFAFTGRNRRPPLDAVNCLLSFLYTLLAHDVRSALEGVGLDPAVGFLHRDRPGRPSLALDIMEEFRPYIADRLACTLINKGQVRAKGFVRQEAGAVLMDDDTRKAVLVAWQERKNDVVEHPFLKEKMPVGLLWHTQARLFARFVRGELEVYPPFTVR